MKKMSRDEAWSKVEKLLKGKKGKPLTAKEMSDKIGVTSRRSLMILKDFVKAKKLTMKEIPVVGTGGRPPLGFWLR